MISHRLLAHKSSVYIAMIILFWWKTYWLPILVILLGSWYLFLMVSLLFPHFSLIAEIWNHCLIQLQRLSTHGFPCFDHSYHFYLF